MRGTGAPLSALCTSVLLSAAACGGGGNDYKNANFQPTGPITVTVFGQHTATNTSPTNPLQIPHGTSVMIHVSEDIYIGTYATTVAPNPPTSTCITIAPPVSQYVFTISASGAATCTYPQTASILFTDSYADTTTLYVEGT
jgi:hypothetical protein